MKHLLILSLILVLCACGSSKKAIKNTSKTEEKKEIVEVVKPETEVQENETPTKPETLEIVTKVETPINEEEIEIAETIVESYESFDHNPWNSLLQKYVTEEGNVNYNKFKKNRKPLTNYITSLGTNMPNETWKKEDKLAYWINAYNAMTVDLIVRNYPIQSIKDIDKPWEQRLWKLGAKWYNLDEIEHRILRKMNEPRIHFGIVCASFSCPKLQNQAFTASSLEEQLTKATKEFLSDTNRNNISENSVKLSKIFKWFASDFKNKGSLIDFINTYSDTTISSKAKKSFKDYNWDLND